jgi:chemotaxis regulatin CheY-phosphate phosphatase CheZ
MTKDLHVPEVWLSELDEVDQARRRQFIIRGDRARRNLERLRDRAKYHADKHQALYGRALDLIDQAIEHEAKANSFIEALLMGWAAWFDGPPALEAEADPFEPARLWLETSDGVAWARSHRGWRDA